eukprot:266489-Prymnesium_polylepis.1
MSKKLSDLAVFQVSGFWWSSLLIAARTSNFKCHRLKAPSACPLGGLFVCLFVAATSCGRWPRRHEASLFSQASQPAAQQVRALDVFERFLAGATARVRVESESLGWSIALAFPLSCS